MTAISERGLTETEVEAAEAKREAEEKMGIAISDFFKHALPYTIFDAGKKEIIDLHPNRHATGTNEFRIVEINEVESDMVEIKPVIKPAQEPRVRRSLSQVRRTVTTGLALLGEL